MPTTYLSKSLIAALENSICDELKDFTYEITEDSAQWKERLSCTVRNRIMRLPDPSISPASAIASKFSALPLEIQQRIWELTLQPRVVLVKYNNNKWEMTSPMPVALQTHQNSRLWLAKSYAIRNFGGTHFRSNPDMDTYYHLAPVFSSCDRRRHETELLEANNWKFNDENAEFWASLLWGNEIVDVNFVVEGDLEPHKLFTFDTAHNDAWVYFVEEFQKSWKHLSRNALDTKKGPRLHLNHYRA
jgi:hypothetical protein